jgi:hypothetical protein
VIKRRSAQPISQALKLKSPSAAAMFKDWVDTKRIVVGKPLPFSIYAADNKLLLAEGQVVTSDGARNALARNGAYVRSRAGAYDAGAPELLRGGAGIGADAPAAALFSPLERYWQEHSAGIRRWRPALRMSRDDADESHTTTILALHDRHSLILSAPQHADGTWVSVTEGQSWVFRSLYHTTALRFQSTVLKAVLEPFPHLHVEVPQSIERRTVRKAPRISVSLHATLLTPDPVPAVVVDLSIGGARIAVETGAQLQQGHAVTSSFTVPINERVFALQLKAFVLAHEPTTDPQHPGISFYRMEFEPLADVPMLTLHAFLSGALAIDLDSFGRLIALVPGPSDS